MEKVHTYAFANCTNAHKSLYIFVHSTNQRIRQQENEKARRSQEERDHIELEENRNNV